MMLLSMEMHTCKYDLDRRLKKHLNIILIVSIISIITMTPALSPPLLDIENQTPSLDPFLPRHFILARAVGRKVKGTEIGNNDFFTYI